MASTFNKELAKKVRNVQEGIKTDFCKYCEEKACDGCFVGDMTEVYTLRAEIVLEQEELDYINGMMSMTGYEIYKKYGFDKGEIVAKTVIFADSFKATIKLISYSTSEPPYLASLLFDKDGTLVVLSAPEDVNDGARFDGDWEFESAGIRYIVTVKAKEPVGYRSDSIFGDGYRDAVDVMAHEIFDLWNADILDTLAAGVLKDTDIAVDMNHLAYDLRSPRASYFADILEEEDQSIAEEKAKAFVRRILNAVKENTGKDIKYVLWLSDSVDDVIAEYELNESITEFDEYSTADSVVLSDIGRGGKLFGYEKLPAAVRTVDRKMEAI